MPIVEYRPGTKQPVEPSLPRVQPEAYQGIVVDDKYESLDSLTAYAEGYPLTVNYYGQLLGENNDPREVDPAQAAVYQQYVKINRLDIRVDQPLDMSYDDNSGLSLITGSANIFPDIIPNTYDYFTARTTRGKTSLFRITNVKRQSMQRRTLHHVEYNMVGYIDTPGNAKTSYENLETKINKQYYYHAERLIEGAQPLLKTDDHENIEQLYKDYQKIVSYYFSTFFNLGSQTLLIPGQPTTVYDRFIVDFLLKITSIQDYQSIDKIKQIGTDRDRFMEQPQLWKAMIERNPLYIAQGNKIMTLVSRANFIANAYFGNAGLYLIDNYVYPITGDTSADTAYLPEIKVGENDLVDTIPEGGTFYSNGNNLYSTATGDVPIYKAVLVDTYYVLSEAFYESQDNWSLLEKVTWDYLNGNMIQLSELVVLTNAFYYLNRLEQFYYGPLLMLLIKDTRMSQYT